MKTTTIFERVGKGRARRRIANPSRMRDRLPVGATTEVRRGGASNCTRGACAPRESGESGTKWGQREGGEATKVQGQKKAISDAYLRLYMDKYAYYEIFFEKRSR